MNGLLRKGVVSFRENEEKITMGKKLMKSLLIQKRTMILNVVRAGALSGILTVSIFSLDGFRIGFENGALASETLKGAQKDLATLKSEFRDEIEKLDVQIQSLKEKTDKKTKATREKLIKDLEDARAQIQGKLQELDTESKEAKSDWNKAINTWKKDLSRSLEKLHGEVQDFLKSK